MGVKKKVSMIFLFDLILILIEYNYLLHINIFHIIRRCTANRARSLGHEK